MSPLTQAVIFCGGRGTRLGSITDRMPKPMVPVQGRPFLEHLLEQLKDAGFTEVVLLTGYLSEQIRRHFGDGSGFGIAVNYSQGPVEWETGQRLLDARQLLQPRFLLMYSDNFSSLRLGPLGRLHDASLNPITLTVVRKQPANIRLGPDARVNLYDPSREAAGLTHVEIGYMVARRDPVLAILEHKKGSFSIVLQELALTERLSAFEQGDVYHSISDLQRRTFTDEYLRTKRIILLDRDGVINRRPPRGGYVTRKEDFALIPEHVETLAALRKHGFTFIVISNQAGIARGLMTRENVEEIHSLMTEQLAARGVVIRDILFCPHYVNDGCSCRKPLPGMFFEVSRRHALRLDRTIYVGDDMRDAQAANAAGCPCLLVGEVEGRDKLGQLDVPLQTAASLPEGMPWLRQQFSAWHAWS